MEKLLETIFTHPLFAVFAGWAAWNVLIFSLEKDKFDKEKKVFPIVEYIGYTYDNWLRSLVFIPVLLYIGYKGLGLNPLVGGELKWNDIFYLCSGFAPELVIYLYKKWKSKT